MKLKMRTFVSVLSVLMITGTLTGCGGSSNAKGSDSSAASSAASKQITLNITYREDGSGEQNPIYKWINNLSKNYPDKNVKIKAAPIVASEGDYFAKIALQLKSSDNCPDIVTEDTFMINSDASAGYLEPLDDKVKGWTDWTNGSFIEALKKGVTAQDGKVYGVPYCTDSRGLWYNKKIFEKAGLPTDWAPKTWDDVLAAARTIKEKCPDVVPIWMNSGKATGEATSMQTYEMLLYGTGDRLYDTSSGKWVIKSQGMTDALNFVNTVYKEKLGPPLSKVLNGQASVTSAREYLPQGKLAISLDGSWITGNWIKGGPAEWADYTTTMGFAAMPTNKGQDPKTITLAGGWALSIPKNGKNKDAAWEFMKFALNKENSLEIDQLSGNITCRADVAKDSAYTSTPFNDIASKFLETAEFRPAVDKYSSVSTEIQTMVESVVSGTNPADAITKYGDDVKRIVGNDKVMEK